MSARQLKAIFAVLAVLVLAYAAFRTLSGNGRVTGGSSIPEAVQGGFDLVRVLRPDPADSLRLAAAGGAWTVNGYPADSTLVRELREGLDTARVGRLVGRSEANHDRLGVSADSAMRIEIGPPEEPDLVFLLGKAGADGRFVRFPPSDDVFAVPTASVRLLRRSVDEWRDRLVAAVDTAAIGRIVVRRNDEPAPVFLARTAGEQTSGWSVDGEPADSATVGALLDEAAGLTATGFPTDSIAFSADFSNPVAVLEMFDSDEPGAPPAVSLLFLTAPDAPEFLVRRADDPLSYRISAAQAERLLPTREMLLGE